MSFSPLVRGILLILALAVPGAANAADGYRLNVHDTVHIRVVAWQAANTSLQDWAAIDGDYTVDSVGNLTFPFIGPTKGAGETTADLAKTISDGLRQKLALTDAPDVTVQIAQFGPVYITGDVRTPGKYAFAPGLNVIEAVSLAGGEARTAGYNTPTETDLISAQGDYQVMQDQLLRLQITRARIDAELANQKTFELPDEIAKEPKAPELAKVEQSVMTADVDQVTSQLDALTAQIATVNHELSVLQQKREATDAQVKFDQQELDNVKKLAGRGLATNDRVATASKNLNDVQVQALDIDTAVLQAQQAIGQAQQQSAQLVSKHTADLTLLRQQTDQQIVELQLKLATQKQLIANAAAYVDQQVPGTGLPAFTYTYSIMRGSQQVSAEPSSPVEPGDVVIVRIKIAD